MFPQKIENEYSAAKISCYNGNNCMINVRNDHNFIMLKGELLAKKQPKKMCDCMVFQDNRKIAIIELKSK